LRLNRSLVIFPLNIPAILTSFPATGAEPMSPTPQFPPDFDAATVNLCHAVQPFTMTSKERLFALRTSVEYLVRHDIPGDMVECGVWRGGSMMAVARTLLELRAIRRLYLFDTFAGMSPPTAVDQDFRGRAAMKLLGQADRRTSSLWGYCPLTEVQRNLQSTGYEESQVVFVKGKVEETIPALAPARIALLRLDTDWYESTYHELVHLYPRLSVGVLLLDDYGHWAGARKAVDQYLGENRLKVLLNRIDYSGRIGVKLEP
jgi:O-methyltransferase